MTQIRHKNICYHLKSQTIRYNRHQSCLNRTCLGFFCKTGILTRSITTTKKCIEFRHWGTIHRIQGSVQTVFTVYSQTCLSDPLYIMTSFVSRPYLFLPSIFPCIRPLYNNPLSNERVLWVKILHITTIRGLLSNQKLPQIINKHTVPTLEKCSFCPADVAIVANIPLAHICLIY